MFRRVTMRKLPLLGRHALYVTSMLALVALGIEIVFLLIYSSLQCKIQHGMESMNEIVSGSYIIRLVSWTPVAEQLFLVAVWEPWKTWPDIQFTGLAPWRLETGKIIHRWCIFQREVIKRSRIRNSIMPFPKTQESELCHIRSILWTYKIPPVSGFVFFVFSTVLRSVSKQQPRKYLVQNAVPLQ